MTNTPFKAPSKSGQFTISRKIIARAMFQLIHLRKITTQRRMGLKVKMAFREMLNP